MRGQKNAWSLFHWVEHQKKKWYPPEVSEYVGNEADRLRFVEEVRREQKKDQQTFKLFNGFGALGLSGVKNGAVDISFVPYE